MTRRFLALLPALAASVALVLPISAQTSFFESFTGRPPAPVLGTPLHIFKTLYSNSGGVTLTTPMLAQHGPSCEGPELTHLVDTNAETVYQCNDHIMTALNSPGTIKVYLTADQMIDFSQGPAVIRWDMSTFRTSSRDWVDFAIQPFADHYQAWGQNGLTPRTGITLTMENQVPGESKLVGSVFRDFTRTGFGQVAGSPGYEHFLTTSKAQRETFEIDLARDHIRVGMPTYNVWWIDRAIDPPLDWDQGIMQWNHAAYNPGKDNSQWCHTAELDGCGPGTWHWDAFSLNPSVPYTVITADREYARFGEGHVEFTQAAPANAWLQFIALANVQQGHPLELSYDGGQTYQRAVMLPTSGYAGDEWYKSYWQQIPAGVRTVDFRAPDHNWLARDFAILAQQGGPVSDATSVATIGPATPTQTPVPTATATPRPEATPTGTPEPVPTVVPTETPVPCFDAIIVGEDDPLVVIRGEQIPC